MMREKPRRHSDSFDSFIDSRLSSLWCDVLCAAANYIQMLCPAGCSFLASRKLVHSQKDILF